MLRHRQIIEKIVKNRNKRKIISIKYLSVSQGLKMIKITKKSIKSYNSYNLSSNFKANCKVEETHPLDKGTSLLKGKRLQSHHLLFWITIAKNWFRIE